MDHDYTLTYNYVAPPEQAGTMWQQPADQGMYLPKQVPDHYHEVCQQVAHVMGDSAKVTTDGIRYYGIIVWLDGSRGVLFDDIGGSWSANLLEWPHSATARVLDRIHLGGQEDMLQVAGWMR